MCISSVWSLKTSLIQTWMAHQTTCISFETLAVAHKVGHKYCTYSLETWSISSVTRSSARLFYRYSHMPIHIHIHKYTHNCYICIPTEFLSFFFILPCSRTNCWHLESIKSRIDALKWQTYHFNIYICKLFWYYFLAFLYCTIITYWQFFTELYM